MEKEHHEDHNRYATTREPPPFSMFSTMVEGLIEQLGEEQFQKLASDFHGKRHDDELQMRMLLSEPWLNQKWRPMVWKLDKDDDFAANFRKAGNKVFYKSHYEECLRLYNSSVLFATHTDPDDPHKGKLLPVAYFNRGVASLQLGEYEDALKDLIRAEDSGYPEHLTYRLLDRKARVLTKLRRYNKAKDVYHQALKYFDTPPGKSIPKSIKNVFVADWEARLKRIEALSPALRERLMAKEQRSLEMKNAEMSCKSDKLRRDYSLLDMEDAKGQPAAKISPDIALRFTPEQGRHYVAERDLQPGDVLVVERPYASVMDPDFWESHCLNCYKRVKLIVPCPNCCSVVFCSEDCRDVATELHHKVECAFIGSLLDNMLNHDKDNAALANRIVIQAGLDKIRETTPAKLQTAEKDLAARRLLQDLDLKTIRYNALYNLQSHTDEIRPDVMLRMGLQALYLTRLLKEHGFFDAKGPSNQEQQVPGRLEINTR